MLWPQAAGYLSRQSTNLVLPVSNYFYKLVNVFVVFSFLPLTRRAKLGNVLQTTKLGVSRV